MAAGGGEKGRLQQCQRRRVWRVAVPPSFGGIDVFAIKEQAARARRRVPATGQFKQPRLLANPARILAQRRQKLRELGGILLRCFEEAVVEALQPPRHHVLRSRQRHHRQDALSE
ncbi:MAG: hypothetical protein AW10_01421 [Candidatus Accumulibacter appositus]|uniref:Uncharacterized protein n=1 Tax=Candidatus Accumulibacter appositus TaxID=1454003 RepID=A0A011NEJ2_9PROT|nr:MAG: hypothetical protein AW10_01421 [Candidatus Accumulibacter appositus]